MGLFDKFKKKTPEKIEEPQNVTTENSLETPTQVAPVKEQAPSVNNEVVENVEVTEEQPSYDNVFSATPGNLVMPETPTNTEVFEEPIQQEIQIQNVNDSEPLLGNVLETAAIVDNPSSAVAESSLQVDPSAIISSEENKEDAITQIVYDAVSNEENGENTENVIQPEVSVVPEENNITPEVNVEATPSVEMPNDSSIQETQNDIIEPNNNIEINQEVSPAQTEPGSETVDITNKDEFIEASEIEDNSNVLSTASPIENQEVTDIQPPEPVVSEEVSTPELIQNPEVGQTEAINVSDVPIVETENTEPQEIIDINAQEQFIPEEIAASQQNIIELAPTTIEDTSTDNSIMPINPDQTEDSLITSVESPIINETSSTEDLNPSPIETPVVDESSPELNTPEIPVNEETTSEEPTIELTPTEENNLEQPIIEPIIENNEVENLVAESPNQSTEEEIPVVEPTNEISEGTVTSLDELNIEQTNNNDNVIEEVPLPVIEEASNDSDNTPKQDDIKTEEPVEPVLELSEDEINVASNEESNSKASVEEPTPILEEQTPELNIDSEAEETELPNIEPIQSEVIISPIEDKVIEEVEETPETPSAETNESKEDLTNTPLIIEEEEEILPGVVASENEDTKEENTSSNDESPKEEPLIKEEETDLIISSDNDSSDNNPIIELQSIDESNIPINDSKDKEDSKEDEKPIPLDINPEPTFTPTIDISNKESEELIKQAASYVEEPTPTKFCDNCGTILTGDSSICPSCGEPID